MNIATIEVSGVYASAKFYTHIPAGLVGATVTFEFTDPRWSGLTKTAVFRGNVTRDVIMGDNIVRVPPETVEAPGSRLLIGVYGVDSNENIVIPTLWTDIGPIRPAADPSGDPSVDPSLPVWAQLAEEIEKLKSEAPDVPGKPGQDGEDGGYYTPSLTQPDENTLEFHFAPSKPDMPTVDPVQVELPNSGGNSVLCVTVRKDHNGITTVSHTNSEIQEAYGKGMEIICHYSDMDMSQSLQLVHCMTHQCTFTALSVLGDHRVEWKVIIERNVPAVEMNVVEYVDPETFAEFAESAEKAFNRLPEVYQPKGNYVTEETAEQILGEYVRKDELPGSGGNVAYDEAQNLTAEQKAQARENIGAQPAGNYLTEVPEGYAKTEDVPTDAEIIQLIKDNAPEPSGGGISVTGATVGQTVKISAVDENGVPTAWEAVDFPSDEHINSLINTALGVIENGTY